MERLVYAWFAVAIGLSASLLFAIEPLWARLLLPRFGGSAAVWSTLLVLYQALLLVGYGLAHLVQSRGVWPTRCLYLAALLLALAGLPLTVPAGAPTLTSDSPVLALLAVSLGGVAGPFLLMSMTNPLLQGQLARLRPTADPYPLYAASNLGSIIGLIVFPIAEWQWSLSGAAQVLTVALAVAGVLTAGGLLLPAAHVAQAAPATPPPAPDRRHIAQWFTLAMLPSAALVGITTWLATAIATVPMLWMLPLGAYLASLVLAFARRRPPVALTLRAAILALVPWTLALALDANHPTWAVLGVHLAAFFCVALACHRRLADLQPDPSRLTSFYLAQSAGGVAGGLAAALGAPLLLTSTAEYPVAVTLALMAAVGLGQFASDGRRLGLAGLPAVAALVTTWGAPHARTIGFALATLGAYLLSRQPARFAVAMALVLFAAQALPAPQSGTVVHAARGFYGIHSVTQDGPWAQLRHGVTVHGRQRTDQRDQCVPLLYYHRSGPIGQLLTELPLSATATLGAVGQGTGCVACYAKSGQRWTFFEIDPLVDRIARDPRWFTYLQHAPVHTQTVLGDARTALQAWKGAPFDLLILDAYSSDSIPIHLLTVEAMALYWRQLSRDGVLAFHVSNRYFDLPPMVAALANASGAVALVREDATVSEAETAEGKSESVWVAVAGDSARLQRLRADVRWRPVDPAAHAWTDDRASALDVLDVR